MRPSGASALPPPLLQSRTPGRHPIQHHLLLAQHGQPPPVPRIRLAYAAYTRSANARYIRGVYAVRVQCTRSACAGCVLITHCSSCTPPPFAAHGSGAGHEQQRLRLARGKHGSIQKAQPSNGAVLSLDLGRQATAGSRHYRRVSALYVHCACTVRALSTHCMCKGRRFDPLPRR